MIWIFWDTKIHIVADTSNEHISATFQVLGFCKVLLSQFFANTHTFAHLFFNIYLLGTFGPNSTGNSSRITGDWEVPPWSTFSIFNSCIFLFLSCRLNIDLTSLFVYYAVLCYIFLTLMSFCIYNQHLTCLYWGICKWQTPLLQSCVGSIPVQFCYEWLLLCSESIYSLLEKNM